MALGSPTVPNQLGRAGILPGGQLPVWYVAAGVATAMALGAFFVPAITRMEEPRVAGAG
jgi:hypothetical protein